MTKPNAKHGPIATAFLGLLYLFITSPFAGGVVIRHVDVFHGSNSSNGLTRDTAFATIQKGIQSSSTGDTVLVWPGVYNEEINFLGKRITVKSAADAAVLMVPSGYAVSFFTSETAAAVLENFVIRGNAVGIHVIASSPTIRFVTIVKNSYGILAEAGANPTISHAILWDNTSSDLIGCSGIFLFSKLLNSHYMTQWGSYGTALGQFRTPEYLTIDASGTIYVADDQNNRIQAFTLNGVFLRSWGGSGSGDGQFSQPVGVAAAPSGNIFVTDMANYRVQEFTNTGVFVRKFGSQGSGDGQFLLVHGIAVDGNGSVYVSDAYANRICKYSAASVFLGWWGRDNTGVSGWHAPGSGRTAVSGSANGEFNYPTGVAVDALGSIYVSDTHNNRIQKFSNKGGFIRKWGSSGSGDGQLADPVGISIDPSGFVYVVDKNNSRVQVFTQAGLFVTKWGSSGSGISQFSSPYGLAVDSSGHVYVSDVGLHRIQKFRLPLFANPAANDFHLRSQRGRYEPIDPNTGRWVIDDVTSPCIDAGNPALNPSAERLPNGGYVNLGAYGNSAYASMSESSLSADLNRDGIVNLYDLSILASQWLMKFEWVL